MDMLGQGKPLTMRFKSDGLADCAPNSYQNAVGSARKVVGLVKELDTRIGPQAKL